MCRSICVLLVSVLCLTSVAAEDGPSAVTPAAALAADALEQASQQRPAHGQTLATLAAGVRSGSISVSDAAAVVSLLDALQPVTRRPSVSSSPPLVAVPTPANVDPEAAARAEAALAAFAEETPTAPASAPVAATPVAPSSVASVPIAEPVAEPNTAEIAAVRAQDGDQIVMVRAGTNQGVATEQRHVVVRDGALVGRVVVMRVREDLAMALVIPGTGPDGADPQVRVGDRIRLAAAE